MIQKLLLTAGLSFIMIACGDCFSNVSSSKFDVHTPRSCSVQDQNQFIYDVLKDSYLWADSVGDINISLDSDANTFLDNFLYKDDRFSYLISEETYDEQFTAGTSTNFGYLSALIENNESEYDTKVAYVYENSPADIAGIRRSDTILSSLEINASGLYTLSIENTLGVVRDVNISSSEYSVINTTNQEIFVQGDAKIGYFVFKSFVGPNLETNLNNSFTYFKENAVTDLIIDLRYNGGGLLSIATHLGSLIAGSKVEGKVFQNNRYNTKYSYYNAASYFADTPSQTLNLSRVFFITSYNTASASEALINALKASFTDVEVITIGTPTFGKPYGMTTMPFCDKVLVPIHFAYENGDGVGGFVDGLTPTCAQLEDVNRDFGDSNETLLQEALYYIENGQCSK